MQICEYFFENACYSVTKYYLCKQNNKRSLLGRKQQSQVARSFPNRYLFSYTDKVTSLFSISCILDIILACKTGVFMRRNNGFCYVLIMKWLHHAFRSADFLPHCLLFFIYMQNCEMAASIRQRVGRKLIFPYPYCFYPVCFLPSSNGVRLS